MRILLTGSNGMLATDVKNGKPEDVNLLETDVAELDITDPEAVGEFFDHHRPEGVINCAAYTAVDRAEEDPGTAFAVNEAGPKNLAAVCARGNLPFVHISTDYVFFGDGNRPLLEDDPCRPEGVYAKSKRAGEIAIEREGGRWLTIRTSWLYGLNGPNFPDTIVRLAGERDRLTIVDDQTGSPTLSTDLAEALWKLVALDVTGYVHFCNRGGCTWYQYAGEIIRYAREYGRLPPDRTVDVVPITSETLGRPAPRPSYSVLSTEKYTSVTGSLPASWESGLERFMRARGKGS